MHTEHETLQLLTKMDLERAVMVQSKAFLNDPLWEYLLPNEQKRCAVLPKFFTPLLRFGILNEQAYGIGTPPDGVVVWGIPNQRTRLGAILGSGFQSILFSSFAPQFIRVRNIFAKFDEMQKRYAPEPHYYLQTISVLPEAQGKGLASKLIKPFLEKADSEYVSTYTETITPENVGLYEHYGFQVMEAYRVSKTDLRLWSFYRPARRF